MLTLLIALLYSTSIIATEFEFDENHDGKADHIIQYSDQGVLLKNLYDSNFDGFFNYQLEVKNNTITEKTDFNLDTKFDEIKTSTIRGTSLELINSSHNKTTYHSILQPKCSYNLKQLEEYFLDLTPVYKKINPAFTPVFPGFQADKTCIDKLKESYLKKMVRKTVSEASQCLLDLAKKNKKKNSYPQKLLNMLYASTSGFVKPTTLYCTNKISPFNDNTIAKASIAGSQIKGHSSPLIIFNPNIWVNIFNNLIGTHLSDKEMRGVLFHEWIHNNENHIHGHEIEKGYTCEACCFSDNDKKKEISCKICVSDYKSLQSLDYAQDITIYSFYNSLPAAEIYFYSQDLPYSEDYINTYISSMINKDSSLIKALVDEKINRGFKSKPYIMSSELYTSLKKIEIKNSKLEISTRKFAKIIFDKFEGKLDIKELLSIDYEYINRFSKNTRITPAIPGNVSLKASLNIFLNSLKANYKNDSKERKIIEKSLKRLNS